MPSPRRALFHPLLDHLRPGRHWLPLLNWLPGYHRHLFLADFGASLIVAALLIPQAIAYALLAGLPPQTGLYASTLPLLAYALFGSAMTQSVGPTALTSMMTASALAPIAARGEDPIAAALLLALLSGAMLIACGLLRLGRITQLLSHPVVSGFTSGTAILIALGQLGPLLQLPLSGNLVPALLGGLWRALPQVSAAALSFGLLALAAFALGSELLPGLLRRLGVPPRHAGWAGRLAPLPILAALAVYATYAPGNPTLVGPLPTAALVLEWPSFTPDEVATLWLPALLLGLVGFLQSITISQSLALARGETVSPDQELIALGAANIAAGVAGALPVSGGFARTAVNANAGARTPLSGVLAAGWVLLVAAWLSPLLQALPRAALAATIILASLKLIDLRLLLATWRYDKRDAAALLATLLVTLCFGALPGIGSGVLLSLALFIHRVSQPQVVVVGRLPGTEHFRNIERFPVQTWPGLLLLRVDESLYFGNAQAVQLRVAELLARHPDTRDAVLILSGVASIDFSAAEALAQLDHGLAKRGVTLYLAELKVPLRQALVGSGLLDPLLERTFLSAQHAVLGLAGWRGER
ncbi:sodium-independent anion transporter [Chitiniphilus shinanonensis]|uniref:Sodium-independent anion transporter n=1 Tax=Chitiniphilus shinanonensis TaxID=553088 RepID=A0ABQ6BRF0_9NEIS|nr:SulP family inorganic anion transporter [Chitiniphilus shinanonensis]GLS03917.1 sodium-independent anion transporter [Chitiniphilus shinanonensis]